MTLEQLMIRAAEIIRETPAALTLPVTFQDPNTFQDSEITTIQVGNGRGEPFEGKPVVRIDDHIDRLAGYRDSQERLRRGLSIAAWERLKKEGVG